MQESRGGKRSRSALLCWDVVFVMALFVGLQLVYFVLVQAKPIPPHEAANDEDILRVVCDGQPPVLTYVLHFYRRGDSRADTQNVVLSRLNAEFGGRVAFINIELDRLRPDWEPGIRTIHPHRVYNDPSRIGGYMETGPHAYPCPEDNLRRALDNLAKPSTHRQYIGKRLVPGWSQDSW